VSLARYALIVLAIVSSSLLIVIAAFGNALDGEARAAAFFGGTLAALNTLLAFFLVSWSEKRSTNVFLGTVLGGMVGRMALMLGALFAAVLYLGLPKLPLTVSLLSYFVLFLVLELAFINKKTSVRTR